MTYPNCDRRTCNSLKSNLKACFRSTANFEIVAKFGLVKFIGYFQHRIQIQRSEASLIFSRCGCTVLKEPRRVSQHFDNCIAIIRTSNKICLMRQWSLVPLLHARCSGVLPSSDCASTIAPREIKNSVISYASSNGNDALLINIINCTSLLCHEKKFFLRTLDAAASDLHSDN